MAGLNGTPVTIWLLSDTDVVRARQMADALARDRGLGPQTRARLDVVIAELATNVVRHAGRGRVTVAPAPDGRAGVKILCEDVGPGLVSTPSGDRASASGLGLGLAAAKELADALSIDAEPGQGTRIEALVWD